MRILHVLDHSLPLHSGYAFRTLAILREQRALGWETLQLTTPRARRRHRRRSKTSTAGTFTARRCDGNSRRTMPGAMYLQEMAATARRVAELARAFRPDVLHAHSPVLNALPALRVGRRLGIPVVYEVRAFWEDAAVDHGTTREGSLRYRASRALETFRAAPRRPCHDDLRRSAQRHRRRAASLPSRITVIPNAVDTDEFAVGAEPDAALRKRARARAGRRCVGFAGSFYAYEGLDLLIEAARAAAAAPAGSARAAGRRRPAGAGARRRWPPTAALADRVVFTGRVPHGEVQRYYDLIDVLAYPRHRMRLTELVTPLKPLEAMAQGRMFVASDVGGHRELIRDGETGFLFPAGDAARWRARSRACWRGATNGRGIARAGAALRRGRAHVGAQRRALRRTSTVGARAAAGRGRRASAPHGRQERHVRHLRHPAPGRRVSRGRRAAADGAPSPSIAARTTKAPRRRAAGLRHAPAVDHRRRRRSPAAYQRGRHAVARRQRRDLQLSRAAQRARGAGPPLPHRIRLRNDRFTCTSSTATPSSSA